jgi:hypothetical protein
VALTQGPDPSKSPSFQTIFISEFNLKMSQEEILDIVQDDHAASIRLRMTLIAAGFVLGPRGSAIRSIQDACKVSIRSWENDAKSSRTFVIIGTPCSTQLALGIIKEAVAWYNCLVDGRLKGRVVPRTQRIHGIEFVYVPPPVQKMPGRALVYDDVFDTDSDSDMSINETRHEEYLTPDQYSLFFGSSDVFGPHLIV